MVRLPLVKIGEIFHRGFLHDVDKRKGRTVLRGTTLAKQSNQDTRLEATIAEENKTHHSNWLSQFSEHTSGRELRNPVRIPDGAVRFPPSLVVRRVTRPQSDEREAY